MIYQVIAVAALVFSVVLSVFMTVYLYNFTRSVTGALRMLGNGLGSMGVQVYELMQAGVSRPYADTDGPMPVWEPAAEYTPDNPEGRLGEV